MIKVLIIIFIIVAIFMYLIILGANKNKTDADLERNLGEVLEVTCYQKVGTKKHFVGVLLNFNKDSITLEEDGKQYLLDRKNISKLTKYIEF